MAKSRYRWIDASVGLQRQQRGEPRCFTRTVPPVLIDSIFYPEQNSLISPSSPRIKINRYSIHLKSHSYDQSSLTILTQNHGGCRLYSQRVSSCVRSSLWERVPLAFVFKPSARFHARCLVWRSLGGENMRVRAGVCVCVTEVRRDSPDRRNTWYA